MNNIEVLHSQLTYWKQRLGGNLPMLDLPTDRQRQPIQNFRGGCHFFKLPKALTSALKQLSQQESVTLDMTLLAAFKTLLYRYTGQEDILVGSPIAKCKQNEIEHLKGFSVDTLVMCTNLSGNPTFRDLLSRVCEVALEAYTHQNSPFEKLVEELQPERNLSNSSLFQVMFVLQDTPMPTLEMASLTQIPLFVNTARAKFDLMLGLSEQSEGLSGWFEYNADLFDAATIARMTGHLQILLEGIVAYPEQRLGELPLLSAVELHQLLVEWNDTCVEYPQDACIHCLFEAQVERTPDAIAVVFDREQLTYRELNRRANCLAHYLRRVGVGPEVLVGICVERSLEMVIGLLGILKAGGAYVPLDPAYPKHRLAFMLHDAQTRVLLTQHQLREELPSHGAQVICLDTDWQAIARESEENLTSGATALNLAYVIYTSGSTGMPKGAMNTHLGICNRLRWMQDTYQLTDTDRVLQKTPFSFDVSVWEFFWPLLTGARLVVARPGGHKDSAYLVKLIVEQQITTLHFVPSMLQVFLEEQGLETTCLRYVICSGEALPFNLQERFFTRLCAELHNLYGPTEAAIDVTFWACKRESDQQIVPIGRPIANTQLYLLDRYMQPVPVGVPGELHIGGVGLARGYLNRPELTAEKFIENPFSKVLGSRLYKTGDLARYLPDGNIEYLGRLDHQVKIRGFRIELGEIEALLGQHPVVRELVVMAREDVPGDKRLVAYVVPHQNQAPMTHELRSFLKDKLPDYMVPSVFVFLEALPLTPNGKVDRRALPTPELSRPELEKNFVAPQDPLELQLTKIWEEVLGIQPIGVRDNFFELGGHSLNAVRLFAQIEKIFGKKLALTTLLQAPTIEQLANILRSWGCDAPIESLVPLKLGGSKPPLFCIYGILLYHDLARNLDPERPVYGVYLQDEVDLLQAGRPEQVSVLTSIKEQASRYLKEIRTHQPVGPYFLAGLCFGGLVAFEIAQQLQMQGEKVALLALFDTPAPGSMKKLSWRERVSIHLENLSQEGSTYALEKLGQRISLSKDRLISVISRIYRKFDPKSRITLPSYVAEVTESDIRQQVRDLAFRNYVPHLYPGKVLLFLAMERSQFEEYDTNRQAQWAELAAGGLEVHHIPTSNNFMLKEPYVKAIVAKLRAYLEQT